MEFGGRLARRGIACAFVHAARHIRQERLRELEQRPDPVVAQVIGDMPALLLGDDQAAIAQTGEMIADVRLGQPGGRDQFADCLCAAAQRLEQAQT